jgi:hypothetical protein
MKCDVCGADNLEGAAYCEDCGAKLVVAQAVAVAASASEAHSTPAPSPPKQVHAAPPIVGEKRCDACGADNPESEQYCVDCGASLGGAAAAPSDTSSAAPPATTDDGQSTAAVSAPTPAASAATAVSRLTLLDKNRDYSLSTEITTIGRRSPADQIEPDIDLTDDDPESYVSRRHAQIIKTDEHYVYEDVGSSNGSFINNVRAQPGVQQILKDGDRVRVGKTEFIFHE